MYPYYLMIALAVLHIPCVTANCLHLPKLLALPGFGWNALTNQDTKQVWQFTYDQCKATDDGKFLIPDNTAAIYLKTNEISVVGEIIERWTDYTAPDSHSMNTKIEFLPEKFMQLHSAFSEDYTEMKRLRLKHEAFTVRSQLRQVYYRINTDQSIFLTDDFKGEILDIMRAVVRNNSDKAEYLIQSLVQDYGTHYTKTIDVGAALIQYQYLPHLFLRQNEHQKNTIIPAGKASLLKFAGLPWQNRSDLDTSLFNVYKKFVLIEVVKKIGHPDWEKGIRDHQLARIDRTGELLTGLISQINFPNASSEILTEIRNRLDEAIIQYYKRNAHEGCTNQSSSTYDFLANIDDGSCRDIIYDFCFGGSYQTCQCHTSDGCSGRSWNNPLTGGASCSSEFLGSNLYSQIIPFSYYVRYYDTTLALITNMTVFTCRKYPVDLITGDCYKFGGLYSSDVINVNTLDRSCPPDFSDLVSFQPFSKLTLCVSKTASPYELPFGGLTNGRMGHQCPPGYKNHLAVKLDTDQIHYCLKVPTVLNNGAEAPLLRPPYVSARFALSQDDCQSPELDDYGTEIEMPDTYIQVDECDESGGYIFAAVVIILLLALFALYCWQQDRINNIFGHRKCNRPLKNNTLTKEIL